jgi:hypothetical protein
MKSLLHAINATASVAVGLRPLVRSAIDWKFVIMTDIVSLSVSDLTTNTQRFYRVVAP